ncbi:hypothetical protein ONS95_007396 [Cadophora gregata]|uniref:uncharacterized protein n=1 Tax=Cadophora gregata TaxID=51156 RepID=UPI0026DBD3F0|nr:uncharacterized protein ONS95_007396 [Cadophora gregata]KAK0118504.1 hypothetical protein ONS96_011601 [Cadophora gregata f. sp. sojae]KAK0125762.1 hypothetical protein ONS95_007396 [Cadophora gregata]
MPPLPSTPLTLHGGCDCTSIRYTITIPALPSRPIAYTDPTTGEVSRYPQSFLDHCNRCRRVSGSIIPAWITVPQEWVTWTQICIPDNKIENTTAELVHVPEQDDKNEKNGNSTGKLPVTNYISSPGVRRSFCSICGTNLAFVNLERDMGGEGRRVATVDIVLGSLERESLEVEGMWPERHEYWDSGVEWIKRLVTEGDEVLGGAGESGKVPRHPEGEWDVVV